MPDTLSWQFHKTDISFPQYNGPQREPDRPDTERRRKSERADLCGSMRVRRVYDKRKYIESLRAWCIPVRLTRQLHSFLNWRPPAGCGALSGELPRRVETTVRLGRAYQNYVARVVGNHGARGGIPIAGPGAGDAAG